MDSSRDCRGRTQPKQKQSQESASSSVDQSPNSQLSAANRPSPKKAQGDTIAQNETSENAQSRSRRFSRGRKRPEDKSSIVGAANQTDAVNQRSSNNAPDCATDDSGGQNGTRKRRKRRARTRRKENASDAIKNGDNVAEVNNNSSQGDMQVKATQNGIPEKRLESVPDKDQKSNKRKAKKKKQKAGSQLKTQSLEAMRNLLSGSPEEIVNWLILEQSSLFGKKQQKRKDEVVAVLVKLLAKACDCECHSDLGNLFSVLSKSWFLTRRVGPILDQVAAKKSKRSQTKHFDLETIRDLAKVLKEILNRFPKASAHLPIAKLHSCTTKLARSGELVDRGISSTAQELMKVRKKEEVTRCRQEAMRRNRPVKTGNVLT